MEGYKIIKPLSNKGSCHTFQVQRLRDNSIFVMKKINYVGLSKSEKIRIVETVNTLTQIRFPGIIRYHNCVVDHDQGTLNLIVDYCPNGTLRSFISNAAETKKPIPEDKIWDIVSSIALSLYECHYHKSHPIAHGSLTSRHVFFDSENNVKIADFSLSNCQEVDKAKDLTDLGIIIYEMATLSNFEETRHISQTKIRMLSEGLREIINNLLSSHSSKFSLLNVLEFPEIALKILEKKIKIEKAIYEQEKAKYELLEQRVKKMEQNNISPTEKLKEIVE
ncbi:putative never in mitosis A-related kinase [Histomonas meleagridis]|uniref:putative never in mitosis A-related kinase n=1 Tax=Histomonas meleagridis TaxID=135588 RepID=UPI00355AA50C|nr:putative never in mitosis A-related kinase [Histomonas meleagridis]KAH0804074.1 putative never in mitosis A-related kinase [Histomonas meleagridis]